MKCTNHQDREATKICSKCHEAFCDDCVIVDAGQATCKNCLNTNPAPAQSTTTPQKPQVQPAKKSGNGWKIALAIIVPLVCLYAFLAYFGLLDTSDQEGSKPTDDTPTIQTQNAGYVASDINFYINNIKQFMQEFDDNSVAANAKYEDKILQITGYITDISEFAGDKHIDVAFAAGDWTTQSLTCYLADAYKGQALEVKKGDKIIIVGRYDGVIITPMIKECQIISESFQPKDK